MDYASQYLSQIQQTLGFLPTEQINQVITLLHIARMERRNIFIMGNGGSASTATHFTADLAKNTRHPEWPDFKVIGLADNMAAFSAYANDEGYENVFARQLSSFIEPGDIVIAISASGNSPNVLRAIDLANATGAQTIGFTGFNGGMLSTQVDINLHVPSDIIEQVEDVHLMFEHMIVKSLRDQVHAPAGQGAFLVSEELQQELASRRRPSLELLYPISRLLSGSLPARELLDRTLRTSLENVGGASGSILYINENGDLEQAALAYDGKVRFSDAADLTDTLRCGLAGWVIENRQAALVANTLSDPRWLLRDWDQNENQARSAVSVPLLERERVSGVLTLVEKQAGQFNHDHLVLLAAIAVFISFKENRSQRVSMQRAAVKPAEL